MQSNTEKEQRQRYNEAAVKIAGEYHAQRYRGLITGAEMPPALAAGGRIGMIGVADDIRDRIPHNQRYVPKLLVPMVDGEDVKLPGEDRVVDRYMAKQANAVANVAATLNVDLNDLL